MTADTDPNLVFLFTDIEGSTRLWEEKPLAMRDALARHDEILRSSIESQGGSVFKTVGDAFYSKFSEMRPAAAAAVKAQRRLAEASWGQTGPIKVRMALHIGPAQERDRDFFGPTLNRVARVLSAGHGGQILLSGAASQALAGPLPDGLALETLGRHRLKDVPELEEISRLRGPGLLDGFPPLRTLAPPPIKLPAQLTPFIGREREVESVLGRLRAGARLITIVGPGGMGKSRLSERVAEQFGPTLAGGAFFVALAKLKDARAVIPEIARVCGPGDPSASITPEELSAALADRELLLVLDNLEQILDSAPEIERLLQGAPRLRVLATSRAPLRLLGEELFTLGPLSLDGKGSAVELFLSRARALRPSMDSGPKTLAAIRTICDRLDGLPLAVELAAARCRTLSPAEILSQLKQDSSSVLDLGAERRSSDERHQTVRATLDWSCRMLSPSAQSALAWLGAFTSSVDPVYAARVMDRKDASQALAELAEASILRVLPGEPVRYSMLCTIQDYSREQLTRRGELENALDAHLRTFECLVVPSDRQEAIIYDQAWIASVAREHDNVVSAIDRALAVAPAVALRMASRLHPYWFARGHFRIGCSKLDAALAAAPDADDFERAFGLSTLATLRFNLGEIEGTRTLNEQARALFEACGPAASVHVARVDQYLAYGYMAEACHEEAERHGEEARRRYQAAGDTAGMSRALHTLGENARALGRLELARRRIEEAIELSVRMKDSRQQALCEGTLAYISIGGNDPAAAAKHARQGLSIHAANCDPYGLVHFFALSARLSALRGGQAGALKGARLLGASNALRDRIGMKIDPFDVKDVDAAAKTVADALDPALHQRALSEGELLEDEQAVALALEALGA